MADIRNDQYLHRPGAGRGAVTPTDPMEVRIFDGAGNPVAPATETTLAAVQAAVGTTNDSAVAAGAAGTVSAKLRRITADLADVLARLNTDLSTRASEQTLVQARDALSALAGTVDAGAQKVTLTGQTVSIGGTTYEFDPPRTIYGLAASRPTASAAHAIVPFAVYVSVDTKAIDQTDGSVWRRWGVA